MNPVSAAATTSGTDPRSIAITGVPVAIASTIVKPNGSGQSMGEEVGAGAAQQLVFADLIDFAYELYAPATAK